jgi:hypothetical protein
VEFEWRGHALKVGVMPYRIYLLQKIQDVFDSAEADSRRGMTALLAETRLTELITLRASRRLLRENHLEVWGERL